MANRIYLEIDSPESLTELLMEARSRAGLLKDINPEWIKYAVSKKQFPIKIPVSIDGIIDLASNPILRKLFGKKLEDTTMKFLILKKE